MIEVAILDDYATRAQDLADWSLLPGETRLVTFNRHLTDVEMVELLQPFHVICTLRERATIKRETLSQLPNLRAIVVTDDHVRTIDYEAARSLNIRILIADPPPELPAAPSATAEFAWALILASVRNITAESDRLRQGKWQQTIGQVLAGKTLGILGLGKVGSRVARLANAFDMRVLAWSQHLSADAAAKAGAIFVPKETLFKESDVVTVHYGLSDRSRGLIGAPELNLMKRSAYLINTSRGPIVDEAALISVLRSRRIAGAGLDVFDSEPLSDTHPLTTLDNVTLTPHLGFVVEANMRRFYTGMVQTLATYLSQI